MGAGSVWIGVILGLMGVSAEAASRFRGEHHWNVYGDFLYMKRSDLHDVSLIKKRGVTLLNTKDLIRRFEFEPGYRVGLTYMPNAQIGFEGVYTHFCKHWFGEERKTSHDLGGNYSRYYLLYFPFNRDFYDFDFVQALGGQAKYGCSVWDAEVNLWRYWTPRMTDFFGLSCIFGLRYFDWQEFFELKMMKPPDMSNYNIQTHNRVGAFQLGVDFQMHPVRWLTWDLLVKGGPFANRTWQSQFLGDYNNTVTLRKSEAQDWQSGIFTDVSAQLRLECFNGLNFHAGYQFLFLSGLSLAPEQISKKTDDDAGKTDQTHGNGIVQGVMAGVTLRF